MKRIYTLMLVLMPVLAFAQSFTLTHHGVRNSEDLEKTFVTIPLEGKTTEELYKLGKAYIQETFKNPRLATKADVENSYIRVSVYAPEVARWKNWAVNRCIEGTYELELRFKDGRIRCDIIDFAIDYEEVIDGKHIVLAAGNSSSNQAIFSDKGKVYMKKEKAQIEDYFNNVISSIVSFIEKGGTTTDDDW